MSLIKPSAGSLPSRLNRQVLPEHATGLLWSSKPNKAKSSVLLVIFCLAYEMSGFNLTLLCFFVYSWLSAGCITFNNTLPLWLGIPILFFILIHEIIFSCLRIIFDTKHVLHCMVVSCCIFFYYNNSY